MTKSTKYTNDEVIQAIKESVSIAQVLRKLNLVPVGGNYKTIHNLIDRLKLDVSHFTGQGHLKGKTHNWSPQKPLADLLIKGSFVGSNRLKHRLYQSKLLNPVCNECGISNWNNKELSLHLDHINGVNNDNRIENLRILCPNCHSQTDTYCAKKR